MAHARRQILDKVITTLTGATGAGSNVSVARLYVIDPPVAGAIHATYTNDTTIPEDAYMGEPRETVHDLTVQIEIYARVVDTIEANLDALAVETETALGADCTLGGLCEIFRLTDSTLELSVDADVPHGVLTLTYTALYRVAANDPETIILA